MTTNTANSARTYTYKFNGQKVNTDTLVKNLNDDIALTHAINRFRQENNMTTARNPYSWWKYVLATIGGTLHFAPEDELYVMARTSRRGQVLLIINRSNRVRSVRATDYDEVLRGQRLLQRAPSGERVDWSEPLSLEPMSSIVLYTNP